jgi:hypothetical protein
VVVSNPGCKLEDGQCGFKMPNRYFSDLIAAIGFMMVGSLCSTTGRGAGHKHHGGTPLELTGDIRRRGSGGLNLMAMRPTGVMRDAELT